MHDRKKWHNFISYDVTNVLMLLNRLNRLHYGFEKFIYFCFQQKKIACIIEIIEKKIVPFFPIMHFVPFFPVPFFPCAFFSCAIFSCAFFSGAILSYTQRYMYMYALLGCKGHSHDAEIHSEFLCNLNLISYPISTLLHMGVSNPHFAVVKCKYFCP